MLDTEGLISRFLIRLRINSPFFATLALFAHFVPTDTIPTAATNGKQIFFNPNYLKSLPREEQDGVFLHEILHAALIHVGRRGTRDAKIWNIAADILVNGAIAEQANYKLPPGDLRYPPLEHLSVEEIYELLLQKYEDKRHLANPDLIESPQSSSSEKINLESYWRDALQKAIAFNRDREYSQLSLGMQRELKSFVSPQLDWRSYLWRYLIQTPTDFSGFDRRFLSQRLYLDSLSIESVKIYLAIDTSGSIGDRQMDIFLGEIRGIFDAYPHLQGELYYADANLWGPYAIDLDSSLPSPQGGGGTSFIPFFDRIEQNGNFYGQSICVYLTDGYGHFPPNSPQIPVLWVVTSGGLDLEKFPFGEAVRLIVDN
jgi:predicted metal-dependent peptidase